MSAADLQAALAKEGGRGVGGVAVAGPVVGSALAVFANESAASASASGDDDEEDGAEGEGSSPASGRTGKSVASFPEGAQATQDVLRRIREACASTPAQGHGHGPSPTWAAVAEAALGIPPRGSAAEEQLVASATIRPPKACYIPFLTGARMCAGKALAETELAVTLAAVLRALPADRCLRTSVVYLAHMNGVPVGAGSGSKGAALFKHHFGDAITRATGTSSAPLVKVSTAEGAASGDVTLVSGYDGPLSLMLQDNMYAGIEGDVPFTVA